MTKICIPRERGDREHRVAATPETVKKLTAMNLEVVVESGAGAEAHFSDQDYQEAGAHISSDAREMLQTADILAKVGPLEQIDEIGAHQVDVLKSGAVVVGLLAPFANLETVGKLAERRITSLPMEFIPRITRAQVMDALSSQANIAGYKAALIVAARLGRYFPLLMTAAGTIPPSKIVVMGGGVAGLQALATAKRLGAIVEVTDIRPAVKEQVESLGGKFIDMPLAESGEGTGGYAKEVGEDFLTRQREILTEHLSAANGVITTAQVPGKRAPILVTRAMVEAMPAGSMIIDLAAEQGGNCELTRPGEEIYHGGVLIMGPLNIASDMAIDASTLYSRNVLALVKEFVEEGELKIDTESDVVGDTLLTHDGKVVHAATADQLKEVAS